MSTHKIKGDPTWVEATPNHPTEENAFSWSRIVPGDFLALERSECSDASVLPWDTLVEMLKKAGFDLIEKDPVSDEVVQQVRNHLRKSNRKPQQLSEFAKAVHLEEADTFKALRKLKVSEIVSEDGYVCY